MKVIVTGGAGRLGQWVIRELIRHGYEVLSIDSKPSEEALCPTLNVDLNEIEKLYKLFNGAAGIVHLARRRFSYTETGFDPVSQNWQMPDVRGDADGFNHNVAITCNVLASALEAGVNKIVSGSSLAVYGLYYPLKKVSPDYLPVDEDHPRRPQDPYGLSKLVGEEICESFCRKS